MNTATDIKIKKPSSRHLVYTSAGDHAVIQQWLKGRRDFDLWVTYYGKQGRLYEGLADFYNCHQGSKWQNLLDIYQQCPELLSYYDSVLVMDDDVIIDTASINRLFSIREKYDLWVCQSAFDFRGKIRHKITGANPKRFLRYVNFIENTCPLFKKDKLDQFMKVYDGTLLGNGVDYWYLEVLGPGSQGKLAIIDAVRCINPHDENKGAGGVREYHLIDQQPWKELSAQLESRYGIKGHLTPYKEFGSIPNTSISDSISGFFYRLLRLMQQKGKI